MKKALKLFLMYLVLLVVSILVGTFLYTLYLDVIGFISGQKLNFFDVDQIIKSFFLVAYCSCFLISPFLCYYRIRHPFGITQTIAFILLILLTWGGLFPGINLLERTVYDYRFFGNQISHLSGGYFRKNGNKVYYFTRDFYSNPYADDDTNTIVIDTSNDGQVTFEKIRDEPDFELYTASKPFNEIQAKESFTSSNYKIGLDLRLLVDKGLECFSLGWTYYLGFISMGILLGTLYVFTSVFAWRLLNTTFVFMTAIVILCINTFFYTPKCQFILDKSSGIGFINKLSDIFDNPVIVILNVAVSLVFVAIGIVRYIVKNKKKAEE